jgi:hypothetical protein
MQRTGDHLEGRKGDRKGGATSCVQGNHKRIMKSSAQSESISGILMSFHEALGGAKAVILPAGALSRRIKGGPFLLVDPQFERSGFEAVGLIAAARVNPPNLERR